MDDKQKDLTVRVGILHAPTLEISLNDDFIFDGQTVKAGERLSFHKDDVGAPLLYEPVGNATFTIQGVTIGVDFHWERKEDQTFTGAFEIRPSEVEGEIYVINIVSIEDYLMSVISSEMKSTASPEFLKAHAVISRSWVLSQIISPSTHKDAISGHMDDHERIVWYDHSDHTLFDVCADDHCQRYQGLTREITAGARQAIEETRGVVLTYEGEVCDARFSKCCGGAMEEFGTCWQDGQYPYLIGKRDDAKGEAMDLSSEEDAVRWIESTPDAFCNTKDPEVLSQVLNDYDLETGDFYRWTVSYSSHELRELILQKSGIDFGEIRDLIPLERGTSGRICRLKIVGTERSLEVGKELEIRRFLSPSHLYSSAFVVDKTQVDEEIHFTLHGAGWGHGVGLCQIGAAVMSYEGYDYRQILSHYYPGSQLTNYVDIKR